MYSSVRDRPAPAAPEAPSPEEPVAPGLGRNVPLLGVTSLLTDISSESVNAVLPLYLTTVLGYSAQAFGLFDGVYQGMSALLRIVGGLVADRRQRHKEVAGAGYALSAACKVGLLATTASVPTAGILFLDRTGKGVRTAPRDALISLSSEPEKMGLAFGIHRALDTVGAFIGPILAFLLLWFTPKAYDSVFVVSLCFAVLGVGVLVCFVQNPPRERLKPSRAPAFTRESTRRLLGNRSFRRITVAGALLGLVTISDAFIYLVYQHRTRMTATTFPLLFVGTSLAYLLLAVPLGRLSDRIGRAPVFLAGNALLIVCYVVLRGSGSGFLSIAVILGLLGTYYAATDGVLMALASEVIPAELRSSGLAWLTTVTTLAKALASFIFGACWAWVGPNGAVSWFVAAMAVAVPVAVLILFHPSTRREVPAR